MTVRPGFNLKLSHNIPELFRKNENEKPVKLFYHCSNGSISSLEPIKKYKGDREYSLSQTDDWLNINCCNKRKSLHLKFKINDNFDIFYKTANDSKTVKIEFKELTDEIKDKFWCLIQEGKIWEIACELFPVEEVIGGFLESYDTSEVRDINDQLIWERVKFRLVDYIFSTKTAKKAIREHLKNANSSLAEKLCKERNKLKAGLKRFHDWDSFLSQLNNYEPEVELKIIGFLLAKMGMNKTTYESNFLPYPLTIPRKKTVNMGNLRKKTKFFN
jgi:hypothetical protein